MAFSMFLRNSACNGRLFNQQLVKIAAQPSLAPRTLNTAPVRSLLIKDAKAATPFLNAIRNFKTSPVCLSATSDHSKLWVMEKITSLALVPLIPLGLIMPNKIIDSILAVLLVAHMHWGLETIAVDYCRARVVGEFLAKLSVVSVYVLSIATLAGCFFLISQEGLAYTVRKIWSIKHEQ